METKICTKCGTEYPATLEYFPPQKDRKSKLHSWCRGCNRNRCRVYHKSTRGKIVSKEYRQTEKYREYQKKFYSTLNGYLQNVYKSMKQRCNNPNNPQHKNYGGRGVKVLFKSSDEFVNYVVNILKVDPRGLRIHRIDNDGHYEQGNIEFLTEKEHYLKHMKLKAKK